MKKSKIAAILAVLFAVSMFGAACSKEETTKKKSKKTKTEDKDDDDDDDDDDDETKKTKKTKKTSEESSEEPTETPEETTTTTTTEETTTKQTTTSDTSSAPRSSLDPLNPNQPTQNYKKIDSTEFISKAESMGWYMLEDEQDDLEENELECLYAYDENMEIVLMYTRYKSKDAAAEVYEEYLDELDAMKQYGELLDSVVTDNMLMLLTEDEYVVIIMLDDVEVYAYTDNTAENVQKANQALEAFGYPIA